jgi:hypothetical protein
MTRAGLFETRREPGQWAGRSGGFSVSVRDSGVRFRFGKGAGHCVQGNEKATIIDVGNISITTQRGCVPGRRVQVRPVATADSDRRYLLRARLVGW